MVDEKRRNFLRRTGLGLAAAGATGLVLRADARPTPQAPHGEEAGRVLLRMSPTPQVAVAAKGELKTTAPMPFGPAYKQGAPFRAKLCPPFEPGTAFVMSGRVWAFDTKRPLAGVVLDVWHVDHRGNYSGGDGDFRNRGRLVTNEAGFYEFESVRPVPYQPNAAAASAFWRCAHFHLLAAAPGYKQLVTEIHFHDDPKSKTDQMFNPGLAVTPERREANGRQFEVAVFDIVLEREAAR